MRSQARPTPVLLAIIAVLLAVNLIVNLPPQEAAAQHLNTARAAQIAAGPATPVPLSISAVQSGSGFRSKVYRLWSDGSVDVSGFTYSSADDCEPNNQCGPVQIIPAPCPADVTADGAVDVLDVIELLLAFGTTCP